MAAFRAPSTETHATGTGGIWTIASRASRPSSTLLLDRSGTPMTGSSLYAATVPGQRGHPRAGDQDADPRNAAVDAASATARIADRRHHAELVRIPRASSSSSAGSIFTVGLRPDEDPDERAGPFVELLEHRERPEASRVPTRSAAHRATPASSAAMSRR